MSILLVGLGAGFLSGVFGVGGGILIVPGLVFFAKMDQRRAHGTSLAAVLPISFASLVTYWSHDHVDWHVALWLAIGAVGGAILGTKLLKTARRDVLSYGFATVLIVSAIRLYWTTSADGRTDLTVVAAIALVVIGVATGTLAGLLGVGGGVIMIPAMVLLLGEMNVMAKGTSLAVIIPTSITGTIRNRKTANVDVKAAVVVGLSGVVSAVAGGSLAANMSESLSNALFATLLLVVAVQMIYRERRVRSSNAPTQ
ncbi:MAG: sulfite exporter TauE/SafE family protein [Acidobacteria bacterium]|nr:sulfite exporter TauE/SafE family protein [Acidobacteriota bacterium]